MFDYLVCTLRKRIKFVKGDKENPSHGNAIIFMSRDPHKISTFQQLFKVDGRIFGTINTKKYISNLYQDI